MEDVILLRKATNLINYLSTSDSSKYKKSVLSQCSKELKKLLKLVYDPSINFNVSRKTIEDFGIIYPNYKNNLTELLEQLSRGEYSGNSALSICYSYIGKYPEYRETLLRIFDKDLKCGINTKTLNDVWKDFIFDFESHVPLANKYKKGLCDFDNEYWFASRKLNGVRCLTFVNVKDKTIRFFSRRGREFFTLNNLIKDIALFDYTENFILDGEICIVKNGVESFTGIVSEIRRKDHTINIPKYFVFDIYTETSFTNKIKSNMNINLRPSGKLKNIIFVRQTLIHSEEDLKTMFENIPDEWEGLILRKYPTLFKRSNNLLKLKSFKEIDLIVTGITITEKYINGDHINCVAAIIVLYNGEHVGVGSGITDNQRIEWYHDNDKILGKEVTIKYFSESHDKNGKRSLQFPTLKCIRDYE